MGKKLMKDRAEKKKKENIKKSGPDAPGIERYKKNPVLAEHNVRQIKDINTETLTADQVPRDYDVKNDEIEIGVVEIKPVFGRNRRVRGYVERTNMTNPADDSDVSAKLQRPGEHMTTK